MSMPSDKELQVALLAEIAGAGGSAKPKELYDVIATRFPVMTEAERSAELPSGTNRFNNAVQWARQRLVNKGLLDGSVRGVWSLTKADGAIANYDIESPQTELSETSLVGLLNAHDSELRQQLIDRVLAMDAYAFEEFCGRLLRVMGFFRVVVTQKSNDGGIDGHGQLKVGIVSVRAAFQCKKYAPTNVVGRPAVDSLRGATQGKYDQAILVTTSSFSKQAADESLRQGAIPIILIDGARLLDLMIEHGIGVESKPLMIPTIDENFFAAEDEDG